MAKITFPTQVEVDDSLRERYSKLPLPTVSYSDKEQAHVITTTVDGLLTLLAVHGEENLGSHRDSGTWHGTIGRDEALTLAVQGWLEPIADVLLTARHVTIQAMTSLIPQYEQSDEPSDGGVDVDAYLADEEFVFLKSTVSEHEQSGRGSVRLVMEPCVSAGMSEEAILQRGSIVAATIWALERAGVKVSLEYRSLVSTGGYSRDANVHVYATIKGFGEPFDLRKCMFWLAHPSASRRAIFAAVYEVAGGTGGDVGWSSVSPALPPRAVLIPKLHTRDMPTVELWLTQVCRAAGIEFGKGKA